jgi:hypothetical protein
MVGFRRMAWVLVAATLVAGSAALGEGGFKPGHLYVSVVESESCFHVGYHEAILEVNPATGDWRVFADDVDDGLCKVNGLRFTPDGRKLLALNFGHILAPVDYGWIQAFNADGTSEVILNQSDGLVRPAGANGLAFDANGDLYVANSNSTILRFPAAGGAGSVFADAADGIVGGGALDFAPNGELFYGVDRGGAIVRIPPTGEGTAFDEPPFGTRSLVFAKGGSLFVAAGDFAVYSYTNLDPASRRLVTTFPSGPPALTSSRDGKTLYAADWTFARVYAVDALRGTTKLVADVTDWTPRSTSFGGIIVYPPVIRGDLDGDGDVDVRDFAALTLCREFSTEPASPVGCGGEEDIDHDGDFDFSDFARFVSVMTGPSQPK